ncbi:MAG: hypothetical protein B6I33_04355 [Propionibacterium sp. 4572_24]|nr:MAG: hypothetical protein B6I33_04355 [Propionibacterium sp. 4572_24]
MTIAIKMGFLDDSPIVDDQGRLVSRGGGTALVERLLDMYPGAVVVNYEDRQCDGFEARKLTSLEPLETLVINLDVIDSVGVFQTMHREGAEPRILNLQWLPPSHYHHKVNFAAMGLAYALFPTLCSGERTAGEHLTETKRPKVFLDVMNRVAADMDVRMEARLSQRDLASVMAMKMSSPKWASVGPLFGQREEYWESLARMTAFLATAKNEAYGFEYLEALVAGAIGVFPDTTWARKTVPEDYPYFYRTSDEAVSMLKEILNDPQTARNAINELAGGSIRDWILEHNQRSGGNEAMRKQIEEWFPEIQV